MIYLGTIANVGSDVLNNTDTAAPFVIPKGIIRLVVQPSTATFMVAVSVVNALFAPAATAMAQLGAANSTLEIPIGAFSEITLASRKTDAGAGTLKVFGVPG